MKFSIITITYNSEKYLREAIQSVLSQVYPDLEYIIVDGGSTDGTLDIVREYAAVDSRIRWVSGPDRGIADAMNKGVALATGDVIVHLHSDDYYPHPEVIAVAEAGFVRRPDSMWLTGGAYLVDASGNMLQEIHVRNYSYLKLVRSNCIIHPATFIRRSAFNLVGGFDISLKYAMDYDLWLRLGKLEDPLAVDRPMACFRVHQGGLSSSESKKAFVEELAIRKNYFAGRPIRFFFHQLYFLVKQVRHRLVNQQLMRREQ